MKSYRPVQPAFDAPTGSAAGLDPADLDPSMHGNAYMNELLRASGACPRSELGPDSGGPPLADWLRREMDGFAAGLGGGCDVPTAAPCRGGGEPLPEWVRREMEPAFGADLGGIRIHHDDAQARAHGANAFTVGNDITFGAGQFAPHTDDGQHRLAHEVAHTLQQSSGPVDGSDPGTGVRTSDPSGPSERAAHDAADRVVAGESLGGALGTAAAAPSGEPVVQREEGKEKGWKHGGKVGSAADKIVKGADKVIEQLPEGDLKDKAKAGRDGVEMAGTIAKATNPKALAEDAVSTVKDAGKAMADKYKETGEIAPTIKAGTETVANKASVLQAPGIVVEGIRRKLSSDPEDKRGITDDVAGRRSAEYDADGNLVKSTENGTDMGGTVGTGRRIANWLGDRDRKGIETCRNIGNTRGADVGEKCLEGEAFRGNGLAMPTLEYQREARKKDEIENARRVGEDLAASGKAEAAVDAVGNFGKGMGLDVPFRGIANLFGLGPDATPAAGEPPAAIAAPEQRPGEPPASIALPDAPAEEKREPLPSLR